MAVEAKRGCGYRKVGGLYLVGAGSGHPCCKMPIILHICPTCNQGIKQSRSWQWIDPRPWIAGKCAAIIPEGCPISGDGSFSVNKAGDARVGLLWVGVKFYPTPADFAREAEVLGVSRRIKVVPRGFVVGKTWVFFAHPKVRASINDATGEAEWLPGIFRIFLPTRIEKIITETMSKNPDVMQDLADRGITPVIVPDDDKDHQGTVYDDSEELPFGDTGAEDQPGQHP